MIFQEVNWIRTYSKKLCPALRKEVLSFYRPTKYLPCFFQKAIKSLKQSFYKVPVIVQINETRGQEISINTLAQSVGFSVKKNLPLIGSFSAKISAKKIEMLAQNSSVKKIWYDREVRAVLDVASPTVKASSFWQHDITGRGVVVAVIDTGIYSHPDLAGRIVGFKDFVNQKTEPYDDNGHGTHVAGDIAANGSQSGLSYKGPAPESSLVGVKVLNKMGMGNLSTVIEGVQWCIENKENLGIRVINMSLGSEATEGYVDDPVCQSVEAAWNSGIVVCVAAGNSGPEPGTIGSPGIHPRVLTVGALDDLDTLEMRDNTVAGFSSRGPTIDNLTKPDVIAPGVNIVSLRAPGSLLDKQHKDARIDEWYTSLSGTSMATPICAGAVAQLLQSDQLLTPDQVKARLVNTANPLENINSNEQGAGLIDVARALGLAQGV